MASKPTFNPDFAAAKSLRSSDEKLAKSQFLSGFNLNIISLPRHKAVLLPPF
jgi:hypothetical protein